MYRDMIGTPLLELYLIECEKQVDCWPGTVQKVVGPDWVSERQTGRQTNIVRKICHLFNKIDLFKTIAGHVPNATRVITNGGSLDANNAPPPNDGFPIGIIIS